MRVVINGMFWDEPNTGSGQYLRGLIGGLTQVAPDDHFTLLLPDRAERPSIDDELPPSWQAVIVDTPFDDGNANLAKLWYEQVGVPRAASLLHADVVHVPYAAPPFSSTVPVVATFHDIIWRVLPEYRGSGLARAYFELVARAAPRTAHILADSEHARRDIITYLGCDPLRVSTVLLAAGPQYVPMDREQAQQQVAERYGLRGPFIYYVGGLDARKNVGMLVRAFARMRRAGGPKATLAIAGRALGNDPVLFPDIDQLIDGLGIRDDVARLDVPREDNPLLYNAATVFASPSRYEGFGLGPLEALSCGTPTIVADASSLPEVVGTAALRVPTDDVSGWASALWQLLDNPALRETLRARGLARATQFSYARVARETMDGYRRALGIPIPFERTTRAETTDTRPTV